MLETTSGQRIYPCRCIEEGVRYLRLNPKEAIIVGLCVGILAIAAIVFLSVPTDAAKAIGMAKGFQWVDKLGISMAARWGIAGGIGGACSLLMLMIGVEGLRQNALDHKNLVRHQRRSTLRPKGLEKSSDRNITLSGTPEEKQQMVINALSGQEFYDRLHSVDLFPTSPQNMLHPIIKGTVTNKSIPFIAIRYSYKLEAQPRDDIDRFVILYPRGRDVGDSDPNWYAEGNNEVLFASLPQKENRYCLTNGENSAALETISQLVKGTHPIFECI